MNLLIKNGTVITAAGRAEADVAVKDGKIEAVLERGVSAASDGTASCAVPDDNTSHTAPAEAGFDEIIDAGGLIVLPGAVDAHTHFELPFVMPAGNVMSADDFFTGTRAAACGGVTAIIDFVTPETGESLTDALRKRCDTAGAKVCIDYGLHMSLPEVNNRTLTEMDAVVSAGVSSFKVFMTYAFRVTEKEFARTLSRCKELGALTMVHAEAHDELEALKAQFIAQGNTDAWHHYLSRDEAVETRGVEQAIALAKQAGAPLYIVHLACAGGVMAVGAARREGFNIYAETCPQYLHFTSEVYKRPDGHIFVCSPPIKGQASKNALLQGIKDGVISTVATDHCPFTLAEKAAGRDDFTKIPNGVMGTQTMYPYILSLANGGYISYERAVALCCANPAEIFGLDYCKGSISAGKDADIVLYGPGRDIVITQKDMHSATDYTIWEGTRLKGRIVKVYSRGRLVYDTGTFTGNRGTGRWVPANVKQGDSPLVPI